MWLKERAVQLTEKKTEKYTKDLIRVGEKPATLQRLAHRLCYILHQWPYPISMTKESNEVKLN